MANVYMMMGVPGSGKSYIARQLANDNMVWVSRDEIRYGIVKPNEPYFAKEDLVFATFLQRANELLREGKDVILDATHLNRASRQKVIRGLTAPYSHLYGYFMDTSLETCLVRNSSRNGRARVPDDNVIQMHQRLTRPTALEGFAAVCYVHEDGSLTTERW